MDWPLIRTTLETWVESITGLPAYWRRQPDAGGWGSAWGTTGSPDRGYIILDIIGRRGVGLDSIEYEHDATQAAGSEIRIYQRGQRQFTLAVQVRCFSATDDADSKTYTSLLRDSTSLPTRSEAVFAAADIAFARVMADVSPGIYELDGRDVDISEIQLRFNATAEVEDTATGYVESLTDFELLDTDNPVPPIWEGDIDFS
ncbi:hypothetical protein KKD03_05645 [Patescibacteria group bacterium]|nr:hypothetical protein [Patescibacteria group bacterium]